jgi:cell division protein FtsB
VEGETGGVPRLRPTRLLAIGGVVLVAFLYWKPAHTYFATKHELRTREAQVQQLRVEKARLEQHIARADTKSELVREARQLGDVKPGERLFIVRNIAAWRKRH